MSFGYNKVAFLGALVTVFARYSRQKLRQLFHTTRISADRLSVPRYLTKIADEIPAHAVDKMHVVVHDGPAITHTVAAAAEFLLPA